MVDRGILRAVLRRFVAEVSAETAAALEGAVDPRYHEELAVEIDAIERRLEAVICDLLPTVN